MPLTLLFLPPQRGGTRTRRDPRNAAAAAMASRKAAAAAQGNGLAAAGRDRAHLELAELGPLLEEKGEQGAAGTASVRRPAPGVGPEWARCFGVNQKFARYPGGGWSGEGRVGREEKSRPNSGDASPGCTEELGSAEMGHWGGLRVLPALRTPWFSDNRTVIGPVL